MTKPSDFDFIIIGGGGAGLAAAIMSKRAGASVMVLEADKALGGAIIIAGGVYYGAGTSVQRAAGIEDSADEMFDHIMNITQWELAPGLIRMICDESGPTLEWLISLGAAFPPELLTFGGPERVERSHPSSGIGTRVGDVLYNAAGAESVEYAVDTRVERLLFEDGRVCGVIAGGTELRAPHVLIATGGFGNNRAMIERLWPTAAEHGDRLIAVHEPLPFILGDGITLGEQVGAKIVGYDHGLLIPKSGHLGVKGVEDVFLPPWIALINREGRRIVDETQSYNITGFVLNQQTDRLAFAIFDERAVREATADKSWGDPYQSGTIPAWEEETIRKRIADGTIITADTIEELAASAGIDAARLARTIATYNEDCAQGRDSEFCKETHMRYPIATPPFYASAMRSCVIGNTFAGLNIDAQCHVLDAQDQPIPGLYAAGEVLGCIQGRVYSGGGMAIAGAVITGRQAGTVVGALVQRERAR